MTGKGEVQTGVVPAKRAVHTVGFLQRRSTHKLLATIVSYVFLLGLSVVFITPFLWALSSSFKQLDDVYAVPPSFIPRPFQPENYTLALSRLPFFQFALNSLFVTLMCVLGQTVTASLVAYSFARMRWPGRNFLFMVLLATMMLPGQVTMIPIFLEFSALGWVGTFKPLIVPAFFGGGAVFIFLMRQFFKGIPAELEDAARIDGCSNLGIYWRIMLPLSRPVLATVAVLSFIGHWHDFMGPLIYLDDVNTYTLQLGLRMFQSMDGSFIHWLMAACMIVLLPVLTLFVIAQRYFVRGIALSGIKG